MERSIEAGPSRPRLATHIEHSRSTAFPPTHPIRQDIYFDSASAPPVPTALYDAAHNYLTRGDGINLTSTHSQSPSGQHTARQVDYARRRVCEDIFGVEWSGRSTATQGQQEAGWDLAFSSGSTASLQLVARSFAFGSAGTMAYTRQAHSSVIGMREIVTTERRHGAASVRSLDVHDLGDILIFVDDCYKADESDSRHLLCLPLQCNATGQRYADLIARVLKQRQDHEMKHNKRRLYILLDAAAYLSSSSRLDMGKLGSHNAPDFIVFSMYKILGTPTGLGGLLMQRSSGIDALLPGKQYFGGGTLDLLTPATPGVRVPTSTSLHQAFEDGTQNVQSIATLPCLLDRMRQDDLLGHDWQARAEYTSWLQSSLHARLQALCHDDGDSGAVCRIYSAAAVTGKSSSKDGPDFRSACSAGEQGPTILFNILLPRTSAHEAQSILDPTEVARLAAIEGIHLRSGRMCNVGAVSHALDVDDAELIRQWELGVGCAGEQASRADDSPLPATAALRLSLSIWNTEEDVEKFVTFVRTFFQVGSATRQQAVDEEFHDCHSEVESICDSEEEADDTTSDSVVSTPPSSSGEAMDDSASYFISSVHLYPIKSCASQDLPHDSTWPLTHSGLLYDRNFGIVDLETGKVLSQKRHPKMARIKPRVDRDGDLLHISLVEKDTTDEVRLSLPLEDTYWTTEVVESADRKCSSPFDLCGSQIEPILCNDDGIRSALSTFLNVPCTLARLPMGGGDARTGLTEATPILFSNESPFLMINRRSVLEVCHWISEKYPSFVVDERKVAAAFRANFIVDTVDSSTSAPRETDITNGMIPFAEDFAQRVSIGDAAFAVLGPCRRCEMVGLDQSTGESCPEILKAVAAHRRCKGGRYSGRILFGTHLEMIAAGRSPTVELGARVRISQLAD